MTCTKAARLDRVRNWSQEDKEALAKKIHNLHHDHEVPWGVLAERFCMHFYKTANMTAFYNKHYKGDDKRIFSNRKQFVSTGT